LRASCDDQGIVAEVRAIPQNDAFRVWVNIHGFAEKHLGILLATQNPAQRSRNFARRERTRRYLVEERLKQMKIATIDERNLHRSTPKFLRGIESSKAATQDQNAMRRRHRRGSFPSNRTGLAIISPIVIVSSLIHRRGGWVLPVSLLAVVFVALAPSLFAQGGNKLLATSSSTTPSVAADVSPAPKTIVIGFLGGYVRHDDAVHSEVQLAQRLRNDYSEGVHVEAFENRRREDAHKLILSLVAADHAGKPTDEQKRAARVILYGHSWGANAVVALARDLESDGIPVLLTVQVDSIAKGGQNDGLIPGNVAQAVNFYQDKGFLRGQRQIRAADASHTQILGNFRMDYTANPIACPQYPWYDRILMRSHIEIECDPTVWQRIEGMIREQLPAQLAREGGVR
jgi:hypothetical protein